jgi:hypothetical protein
MPGNLPIASWTIAVKSAPLGPRPQVVDETVVS